MIDYLSLKNWLNCMKSTVLPLILFKGQGYRRLEEVWKFKKKKYNKFIILKTWELLLARMWEFIANINDINPTKNDVAIRKRQDHMHCILSSRTRLQERTSTIFVYAQDSAPLGNWYNCLVWDVLWTDSHSFLPPPPRELPAEADVRWFMLLSEGRPWRYRHVLSS